MKKLLKYANGNKEACTLDCPAGKIATYGSGMLKIPVKVGTMLCVSCVSNNGIDYSKKLVACSAEPIEAVI